MTNKKLQPIERTDVKVYSCPVCPETVVGTLEEAREHVRIPLSRGLVLPRGFTFGYYQHGDKTAEKLLLGHINIVRRSKLVTSDSIKELELNPYYLNYLGLNSHDLNYLLDAYKDYTAIDEDRNILGFSRWDYNRDISSYANSRGLFEEFKEGKSFILTPEEFADFKNRIGKRSPGAPLLDELIRTNNDIDIFLSSLRNGERK